MKKHEILSRIVSDKLVGIIRSDSIEEAIKIADACIEGGISIIEVTFTSLDAPEMIKTLSKKYKDRDVLIGAGTVLDPETARIALISGAEFIISPSLNPEVIKLTNRYNKLSIPGVMTATEIVGALELGVELVKVFPASSLNMNFIKSVQAPLPQIILMPTGGVSLDNAQSWLDAGSSVLGIGGNLTKVGKDGDYRQTVEIARKFRTIINEYKEEV